LNLLNPKGVLYFSTNSRRLIFDSTLVLKQVGTSNVNISDITEETIPQDFKGTKIHRCWKIQLD
jgi:23S rRNA (cytosine1962-C5)-methyltransferase